MSETSKFRIWSNKHQLFVDDPIYPSNQHTWSEFYLSPDGQIYEFVTCDGENFVKQSFDGRAIYES